MIHIGSKVRVDGIVYVVSFEDGKYLLTSPQGNVRKLNDFGASQITLL